MSLKFLIDENMPRSTTKILKETKYDVIDIRDIKPPGIKNGEIFAIANQEKRVIISRNKGFGNIIEYPVGKHPRIIVLKTKSLPPAIINKLLIEFLEEISTKELKGALVTLELGRYRIRRPI
jgi:predicted nuclease of predicted toxin-antitoxin system